MCRVDRPLEQSIKDKISLFCNVPKDCVIENDTMDCLYEAPLMLHAYGLDSVVCRRLQLKDVPLDLSDWKEMVDTDVYKRQVFILWLGWYGFNGAAATSVEQLGSIFVTTTIAPAAVSYTHLDVYKRQVLQCSFTEWRPWEMDLLRQQVVS